MADRSWVVGVLVACVCWGAGVLVRVGIPQLVEVFTLRHEFLQIPPDSQWKVGIPWNSMEFVWKAFGWSLSHLGFHFHGNSHFFPRIPMEMVGSPEPLGMIPDGIHGILLEFHWKQHYSHLQK